MSTDLQNCFYMGVNHSTLTPNFLRLPNGQAARIAHIIGETELRQACGVERRRRRSRAGSRLYAKSRDPVGLHAGYLAKPARIRSPC